MARKISSRKFPGDEMMIATLSGGEMETKRTEAASVGLPVFTTVQKTSSPSPKWSSKFKGYIILAVLLSAIVGTTIVLAIYFLRSTPATSQVFHITIANEETRLPMEIRLDQQHKTEFIISPVMDENSTESILILRDYNKGMSAHKDSVAGVCFIGKLEVMTPRVQTLQKTSPLHLNGTHRFVALNDTVDPRVLGFTAGEVIEKFCNPFPAKWIIHAETFETEQQQLNTSSHSKPEHRTKRFFWFWGWPWWRYWGGGRCYPLCSWGCYRNCIYG